MQLSVLALCAIPGSRLSHSFVNRAQNPFSKPCECNAQETPKVGGIVHGDGNCFFRATTVVVKMNTMYFICLVTSYMLQQASVLPTKYLKLWQELLLLHTCNIYICTMWTELQGNKEFKVLTR